MFGTDMLLNAVWEKVGITPDQFQQACALVINHAKDSTATLKRLEGHAQDTTASLDDVKAQLARLESLIAEDSLDKFQANQGNPV